ncbi:Uncharacterised protein [Mycobacteroides abscessus subsp. abscessus]|nr:Uncharacterised protein [Mycobacteroides abscessus subsp. abscessus]
MRITVYFTLVDQTFFRLVYKFDWVFDGQNMVVAIVINKVNHRGKCG